jgi:integrase
VDAVVAKLVRKSRQSIGRLSPLFIKRVTKPGVYADGGNLYLQVDRGGSKSWLFRYGAGGRRYHGLGALHTVSVAQARAKAIVCRQLLLDGRDPIDVARARRAQAQLDAAKAVSFRECAQNYIKAHRAGWRNAKHAAQWEATLTTYAQPIIGELPVQAIDTALVLKVLEPIWTVKPETASRVRGRIEKILDWAKVRGYRDGENAARWRGHMDKLLPAPSKVRRVTHHAALPYTEMSGFIMSLSEQEGIAARALEYLILTAARTGEVIGARWSEIDFAKKIWAVPAERMKGGRIHRVPLSARAMSILGDMKVLASENLDDGFIFPGSKSGMPLSNMALLMVLRRIKRGDLTAHGFRSTFRDWAAERTTFPNEVAEMALAHVVGDKVEAAYRRGDLFEKRRRLMEAWASYSIDNTLTGKVVKFR